MTNDMGRSDVAKNLRVQLNYMRKHEELYKRDLDSMQCGNRAYRCIACSVEKGGNFLSGNYIHIVEKLAEIISINTAKSEWN